MTRARDLRPLTLLAVIRVTRTAVRPLPGVPGTLARSRLSRRPRSPRGTRAVQGSSSGSTTPRPYPLPRLGSLICLALSRRARKRFLLLSCWTRRRAMITKDSCTYTIIFLRQDKSLRDHRDEHRLAAWHKCHEVSAETAVASPLGQRLTAPRFLLLSLTGVPAEVGSPGILPPDVQWAAVAVRRCREARAGGQQVGDPLLAVIRAPGETLRFWTSRRPASCCYPHSHGRLLIISGHSGPLPISFDHYLARFVRFLWSKLIGR
jgi:hypothetical protein